MYTPSRDMQQLLHITASPYTYPTRVYTPYILMQAVRSVEDLQWLPPDVPTLNKRIEAGAGSTGPYLYLPPAGLVIILVQNATKSRHGPLLGPHAALAWVCLRQVRAVATIRVANIALPGAIQSWKSKTRVGRYTMKPPSTYEDQVREWADGFVVGYGTTSEMLVPQGGELIPVSGLSECLAGTTYARAR